MQAGFIGLGTMGASMAANLQKGLKKGGALRPLVKVADEDGRTALHLACAVQDQSVRKIEALHECLWGRSDR